MFACSLISHIQLGFSFTLSLSVPLYLVNHTGKGPCPETQTPTVARGLDANFASVFIFMKIQFLIAFGTEK